MDDSDEIKELKKRALEIKKLQKLKQVDQEWEAKGMIPSGGHLNARGLVEAEFTIAEQLIDAGVNLDEPRSKIITSPIEREYWYEDKQLKFRLTSGRIDQFDFSKAELSRKLFEAFWYLWEADNSGEYTRVQVKDRYKGVHKEELRGEVGEIVSNIRRSIINPKESIKDRILWEFDRKKQGWFFRIT